MTQRKYKRPVTIIDSDGISRETNPNTVVPAYAERWKHFRNVQGTDVLDKGFDVTPNFLIYALQNHPDEAVRLNFMEAVVLVAILLQKRRPGNKVWISAADLCFRLRIKDSDRHVAVNGHKVHSPTGGLRRKGWLKKTPGTGNNVSRVNGRLGRSTEYDVTDALQRLELLKMPNECNAKRLQSPNARLQKSFGRNWAHYKWLKTPNYIIPKLRAIQDRNTIESRIIISIFGLCFRFKNRHEWDIVKIKAKKLAMLTGCSKTTIYDFLHKMFESKQIPTSCTYEDFWEFVISGKLIPTR